MKRVSPLLVGLLCLSVVVHAGEVITNDTSDDATGWPCPVLRTSFRGEGHPTHPSTVHGCTLTDGVLDTLRLAMLLGREDGRRSGFMVPQRLGRANALRSFELRFAKRRLR